MGQVVKAGPQELGGRTEASVLEGLELPGERARGAGGGPERCEPWG